MLTDMIRDRIVRASLEISNAKEAVGRVLGSIVGFEVTRKEINPGGNTPVSTSDMPLTRAMDLLEAEILGLQRELERLRGEPEPAYDQDVEIDMPRSTRLGAPPAKRR